MIIVSLTKNSEKTISETIKSLESQTFNDIFWLIFDDKSEDNTISIIKKCKIKHEIISIETNGIFFAYNEALRIIKKKEFKDIIFFLHSDDIIYESNTLKVVSDLFKKKNISSLIGNIAYFRKDQFNYFRVWKSEFSRKQILIENNLYKFSKFSKKDLLFGWSFPHTSFFFHTNILNRIPKYDETLKTSSDYGWSLEILLQNQFDIYYFDEFLVKMKTGGTSTNLSNLFIQLVNDFKVIKKFFFKEYMDIFVCLWVLSFKKLRKIKQFFYNIS